jgi:hypothetical protein
MRPRSRICSTLRPGASSPSALGHPAHQTLPDAAARPQVSRASAGVCRFRSSSLSSRLTIVLMPRPSPGSCPQTGPGPLHRTTSNRGQMSADVQGFDALRQCLTAPTGLPERKPNSPAEARAYGPQGGKSYCWSTVKRPIEYPSAPPTKTSDRK